MTVHLPREPKQIHINVSSQEAIHDVRQAIIELPGTFQYSCFHLEHKGARINDYIQISEVEGLSTTDPELYLVEDPYSEKDARLHVIRIREIIGAAGDRVDTLQGILSGLSLHDPVTASIAASGPEYQPLAGYDFSTPGVLSTIIPPSQEPAPKTIKGLSVSAWNPPPYHLRQKGHLLYLQVTTNEGEQYQITSHVSGFYVNKSSNSKFDPFPRAAPKAFKAHSLLTLINDLSSSFAVSLEKLQEYNNTKEPLAHFQITNATPANPWMVPASSSPLLAHQSDITRTQESFLISGIENAETLRDWNEEFQTTRELPKDSVQDRVFRERVTSKLFADYNDAAARGAVLVARGEVAPLNPTEARDAQIFVYNNIFFSFGADGVGTFASEGGDEAARVATGKDVLGIRMVNQFDIEGLFTPGTLVADYLGKRIVGQSIVPGIFKQRDPEENQIDYGAVDGKDVIAADQKFAPVFEKLSKALKVKAHPVWDKDGKRFDLEGSMETKGLLGTDGRKYVLDLYRVTPLDISWMEQVGTALSSTKDTEVDENAYPHRMTVLRPELVGAYWNVKMLELIGKAREESAAKKLKSKSDDTEPTNGAVATTTDEASDKPKTNGDATVIAEDATELDNEKIDFASLSFTLNPDVFTSLEPQTDEEKADWERDEKEVKLACDFLRNTVVPKLLKDLENGDIGFPMDGQSLTRILHNHGINIRYLGKIAELAVGKKLEALRILVHQEMISRAFKHVAAKYLRYIPIPLATSSISHLLNCLLGTNLNSEPKAIVDEELAGLYPDADLSFQDVTPASLRRDIEHQILIRYRYTIADDWASHIKPMQLLRDTALKMGLQLEKKDYQFTTPVSNGAPAVNGSVPKENGANGQSKSSKKKKKTARDGSPSSIVSAHVVAPTTFVPGDILNITPVIKEASPISVIGAEAFETGKLSIQQGEKKLGMELLLESLSLHEQIYGIIHPEVARIYSNLAMIYYSLEEKDAAVELARKSVIVSERTIGVDSTDTLLAYLNLGLFSHGNGETKLALGYVRHALELWKVVYGPNHPDSITTINNAAVMLQSLKQYHESRLWFEACLETCEGVYGKSSINSATLLFQLAQALALDDNPRGAVDRMRESYNIFLKELGKDDKNTKEAENWLGQLTQNAVSVLTHQRNAAARNGLGGIVSRAQPLTGQSAAIRSTGSIDQRKIDDLLKFIEGKESETKTKKKKTTPSHPKRRRAGTGTN